MIKVQQVADNNGAMPTKTVAVESKHQPSKRVAKMFKTEGVLLVLKAEGSVEEIPAIRVRGNSKYDCPAADAHLDQFQEAVGGYYEVLRQIVFKDVRVLINEDGLNLQLPVNGVATVILQHVLVGDVVFVKLNPPYMDGLDQKLCAAILEAIDAVPPQRLALRNGDGTKLELPVKGGKR